MSDASPSLYRAAKSGTAIGVAQLTSYAVSLLLNVAIAAAFGAASSTDAYFMATSTAELLAKILLGGALTSVLLPRFVALLATKEEERAWQLFSKLLSLALVAFLALGTIFELSAGWLMDFLAPGFTGETRALTVVLLRLVLPAYLLSFLADLASVPLHAHRRFGIPAGTRLVVPTLTLLLLLTLAGRLGVRTLALGTLAGTAAQLFLLVAALRRSGYRPRFSLRLADPDLRSILRLTLPFALSILAAQGAGTVYRILVSAEPAGALASLKFSERIFQITNVLFLGTITQVAFPAFAKAAAVSMEEARQRLRTAARFVTFLGIPLTVGITLLREPLVRALYERGAFTAADTAATAALVPFFVVGLLGNGLSSLLGHLVLAFQETKVAVAVNVALQAIAASLFVLLTPSLGVSGLALVSGLGPFVLTALYLWAFRHRVPRLAGLILDAQAPKVALAGVACGMAVVASTTLVGALSAGLSRDLLSLATGGTAGALIYLLTAWLLRVPEVGMLRDLVRHALRKFFNVQPA